MLKNSAPTPSTDWATKLSASQLKLIQQGNEDLKAGRVMSHAEAKSKISSHIKNKLK